MSHKSKPTNDLLRTGYPKPIPSDPVPTAAERQAAKDDTRRSDLDADGFYTNDRNKDGLRDDRTFYDRTGNRINGPVDEAGNALVTGPFAVMSNDRFILKDTNNDGIPDTVVVERPVKGFVPDSVKYRSYFAHLQTAKNNAARVHAGKSADDITAAQNVAVEQAKREWKGDVPPVMPADTAVEKAKADAKANKDAIQAELKKIGAEKA